MWVIHKPCVHARGRDWPNNHIKTEALTVYKEGGVKNVTKTDHMVYGYPHVSTAKLQGTFGATIFQRVI